jgi:gamma-glutamyl hercynylcysteine S-oxide synthase
MAQTLVLTGLPGPAPQGPPEVSASGEVTVAGGPFTLGSTYPWAYDNERPAHLNSEAFFGDEYRVLRGGSWVTDSLVARPSFRNWDLPERRQIFSGLRCARDA